MSNTWILVANGQRARVLQHDRSHQEFAELADFIYPAAPTQVRAGHRHASEVDGGKSLETQRTIPQKAHRRFARQLAEYVNHGLERQRCDRIALVATGPMLGVLRPMLSTAAKSHLLGSVEADYTRCQDHELQQRLLETLGPQV